MKIDNWIKLYEEVSSKLRISKDHILKLSKYERQRLIRETDELRDKFISAIISESEVKEALEWVSILKSKIDSMKSSGAIEGVTFAREFKSFIEDPLAHLKKKIFVYTFDLLSGKITVEDFIDRAGAALRTSLRTNMRSLYQTWVFLVLVSKLVEDSGRIVYPEHKYIYIERNARQKIGILPPNCIVEFNGGKQLSFFIEVPRPLAWQDSGDLRRVWKFYVALRPDFMIYGGSQMNIAEPEKMPPVKRPNVIVECKELEDWFKRSRDLRGWWTRAMSAEEWRLLWLRGLWEGLAEAMGVKTRDELVKSISVERKSLRLKEYRLIQIYRRFYRPDTMMLITRTRLPSEIRDEVEESGIVVYDDVGFNEDKLVEAVNELKRYGRESKSRDIVSVVREKFGLRGYDNRVIERAIVDLISEHYGEFLKKLSSSME